MNMLPQRKALEKPETTEEWEVPFKNAESLSGFKKDYRDKPRFSLFPQEVLDDVIAVLEYGARKYSANNWMQCNDPVTYDDAAERHLSAYRKGEETDPETGLPHLAHALANYTILAALNKRSGNINNS